MLMLKCEFNKKVKKITYVVQESTNVHADLYSNIGMRYDTLVFFVDDGDLLEATKLASDYCDNSSKIVRDSCNLRIMTHSDLCKWI